MKFKVKWTASYVTEVEAPDVEAAKNEACQIEIDVPGSKYVEDSWEVQSLTSSP